MSSLCRRSPFSFVLKLHARLHCRPSTVATPPSTVAGTILHRNQGYDSRCISWFGCHWCCSCNQSRSSKGPFGSYKKKTIADAQSGKSVAYATEKVAGSKREKLQPLIKKLEFLFLSFQWDPLL